MIKTRSGFTIVELLIVIVVIGILAAITIVAYNGIQQRAKNVKTVAAVKDAVKLLQLYKVDQGVYPTGYSFACIGEYTSDVCQYVSPGNTEVIEQASFKSAISSVGTMPQPSDTIFTLAGTRTGGGAFYRSAAQDIVYYLSGTNQACSAGGTASNQGTATECDLPLP